MTAKVAAVTNVFLRQVIEQTGGKLGDTIAAAITNTVETMFGQKTYPAQARTAPDPQRNYAAVVTLTQDQSFFKLRLSFDMNLIKTLVAASYPLEAANSDEILLDAVSEVANVVSARMTSFVNGNGYNITRDIPVAELGKGDVIAAGSVGLNFSIFRNNLAVKNLLTVSLI